MTIAMSFSEFQRNGGLMPIRDELPDDFFIVCASYEIDRSTAIAESMNEHYSTESSIIYVNNEFTQGSAGMRTSESISRIKHSLEASSQQVNIAEGSLLDLRIQLRTLRKNLEPVSETNRTSALTIDVTTFNREALLTTLTLIRCWYPDASVRILYVSPSEHGEWLSRGCKLVRNALGFAGEHDPNRRSLLVVLSGFETERVLHLIEEHEPTKVLLGLGNPPTNSEFLARNRDEQKLVLARQDVERFEFPANDIVGCADILKKLVTDHIDEYNIAIAPMSTKLTTISVFLIAEAYPDVQVTHCVPDEYNTEDYSCGISDIYIDSLPRPLSG